ncbi:MAG TPA: hypothetical protein VLN26_04505 [Gaiellaceae bacterium]|nr:hypothetical protein [Gaiellaceae bacterium]
MHTSFTPAQFVAAWAIAAAVAIAVFLHANKHGSRHATAWGIGVFLFMIVVLPAYFVHTRIGRRTRR